jgi:hypothetical protein
VSKHFCLQLSIRGALHKSDEELWRDFGGCIKINGTPAKTVHEIREAFMDELAKGNEYLPMGGCDNFDPKKGCLGHDIPEVHELVHDLDTRPHDGD